MYQQIGLSMVKSKSLAKSKFDVYPSTMQMDETKWYKSKGGGWKTE